MGQHIERMDKDNWVRMCKEIVVEGHGESRPQKTWDKLKKKM